jgi:hypothetical protein
VVTATKIEHGPGEMEDDYRGMLEDSAQKNMKKERRISLVKAAIAEAQKQKRPERLGQGHSRCIPIPNKRDEYFFSSI